jgi:hypothetical protein
MSKFLNLSLQVINISYIRHISKFQGQYNIYMMVPPVIQGKGIFGGSSIVMLGGSEIKTINDDLIKVSESENKLDYDKVTEFISTCDTKLM